LHGNANTLASLYEAGHYYAINGKQDSSVDGSIEANWQDIFNAGTFYAVVIDSPTATGSVGSFTVHYTFVHSKTQKSSSLDQALVIHFRKHKVSGLSVWRDSIAAEHFLKVVAGY